MVELHFRFGQLGKEVGENGDMSETVGDTPAIQTVSRNLQLKGRALPVFRVGRHDVEMRAHKSNGFVGASKRTSKGTTWIAQDKIPAAFGITHSFHL